MARETDRSTGGAPVQLPRHYLLSDLIGPHKEAIIEHAGHAYRLRLTSRNRLILTK